LNEIADPQLDIRKQIAASVGGRLLTTVTVARSPCRLQGQFLAPSAR
jgi:hypothetical protein